jgi:aminoglycoside 3-N-acetyltransferase
MEHEAILRKIIAGLKSLGVESGDALMMHASLRSIGKIEGGAETLIQGLMSALGSDGTLLMPALSYKTVTPEQPVFDVRETPSCVGALTEYFRTREGTMRSLHPTHSVCAVGHQAKEILADHIKDTTPCGPHSPFSKLPACNGKVLMIGCGLKPNTSMHAIEEKAGVDYVLRESMDYTVIDEERQSHAVKIHMHDFRHHEQRYDRVAKVLAPPSLRTGKILKAQCHLIDAVMLHEKVLETLKKEPFFFVDPK